jgi:hypothetical protein
MVQADLISEYLMYIYYESIYYVIRMINYINYGSEVSSR